MKKKLTAVLTALLFLTGCGTSSVSDQTDTLKITVTVFPEYDWVMNILGDDTDGAEVTVLMNSGTDLHSYQPTAQDIVAITDSDVFIYVGGESDEWIEDVLSGNTNQDLKSISLMDVLGSSLYREEQVEGMQETEHHHDHEEEEEHDHEEEEHDHEHETEYDEHVWLSLRNAETCVTAIAEAIGEADPENAQAYLANAQAYNAKLQALDEKYTEAVNGAQKDTVLFADRFPFRYMTEDYGLKYYAAFAGCSAETEASFETVIFLAEKTDELGLHAVLTIEGSDQRIAATVIENTEKKDAQILTMNSMQNVTAEDINAGVTYLQIMEGNLEVLKEALK